MRWLIRVTISFLLLAQIGVGYQFVGMAQDREQYPPPGKLIDVGGHTLHLYCPGEGGPTVILEAAGLAPCGCGLASIDSSPSPDRLTPAILAV